MIYIFIIFFIAMTTAFGMLLFRAWEIKTNRVETVEEHEKYKPELSFKKIEKISLFLAKHTIQWIVLSCVKLWFTITTKIKIFVVNKLPKINKFFHREIKTEGPRRISFIQRAIIESKIKIKKVREKIQKEHEDKIEAPEEVDKII